MPEYLSPGVYIEEVNSGPRPIEGVGTAMAAFVGFAPAGDYNSPKLITNWTQFEREFGLAEPTRDGKGFQYNAYAGGYYLAHAVRGYFLNGGGRCYVTRVELPGSNGNGAAPQATSALALPSRASRELTLLSVTPKESTDKEITVEIAAPTGDSPPEGAFTIKVRSGEVEETYENVTIGKKGQPNNIDRAVNRRSRLVKVEEAQAATAAGTDTVPELGTFTITPAAPAALATIKSSDFVGNAAARSGVEGLEVAEDVTMICCPDVMYAFENKMLDKDGVIAVQMAMINHCENNPGRMAIIDPLPNLTPQEARQWRQTANYDSMHAALYYPWVNIMAPGDKKIAVPPSGHMAGIWARSDGERGVHKAPANEVVRGALAPAWEITSREQDTLNPDGVNCIRTFTGRGVRVWGARTLSSDPAWRYINVRRLFNYVEKSIERGTQWVVFEPNDPDLWARVRRDVGAFLTTVWRDGMLFGLTPDEAFFVKCDAETNPPESRDLGRLVIEVGIAPVKPAEFVIFRFSQFTSGGA